MTTFKVTHPDGTVSTRTSKTRIYTHAVVALREAEAARESLTRTARAARERAQRLREAAVNGKITLTPRAFVTPGSDVSHLLVLHVEGAANVTWYADKSGVAASPDIIGTGTPREVMGAYALRLAEWSDQKAAELEAQAEATVGEGYSVLRWSQRRELAVRAIEGDLSHFVRNGYKLRVVEVDHE